MLRQVAALTILLLTGCGSRQAAPVEDLTGSQDVGRLVLQSLRGTRDGERLAVEAVFGDGAKRLTLDLRFQVTPPAKLESGLWNGMGASGTVRERSVTFLGGQNGPPSIGGSFELRGPDQQPRYRVQFPVQELKNTL